MMSLERRVSPPNRGQIASPMQHTFCSIFNGSSGHGQNTSECGILSWKQGLACRMCSGNMVEQSELEVGSLERGDKKGVEAY